MVKSAEHLQEPGGARGKLRPRVEGESLKVAETILKKRRDDLKEKSQRAANLRKLRKANRLSLQTNKVKSAQHFVKKALVAMQDRKRVHVQRNRRVKQQRFPHRHLYCVIRNHRKGGCKATKAALRSLGLKKPYSCTLIANDENATRTLRLVSPFVFYGLPSEETIRRLFLTRGRMQSEDGVGEGQPLSDNVMVEEAFGAFGILCVEDILQEILTGGPHVKQVLERTGKFQLANIKSVEGLEAKRIEHGFLGKQIDVKVNQLT